MAALHGSDTMDTSSPLPSARVVSVNVGLPREASWRGKPVETGIFKSPVAGRVTLGRGNLAGDAQADLSVHGGPDKALYAYPSEHYPHWCAWLGVERLPWGAFGENLSTEGWLEDACIGDRVRIGTALLEVSQPRIPCHKLALRHERSDLPKAFLASDRSGFYLRVLETGELGADDAIELVSRDAGGLHVRDVNRLARGDRDVELLRRAAGHPALAAAWRAEARERLG